MSRGRWFRKDIEGIRGFAMIMVLLAHAGFGFAEGGYVGLDLFFVISGFLITTLLLREFERHGTVSITKFYARRIRRLLPAAALVLVAIVVLSQALFSPARNELVAGDVLSAILYFVNWHLASQSVDYFAQGFEASPVQHFWSLAVEEQFYIVWPLLLLTVALLALRGGRRPRAALAGVIALVGLASLVYSARFTPESPAQAYFSTLTRIWEIGLGALLAVIALPRVSSRFAGLVAGAGLAAIVVSFLALNEETPFPGLYALAPTLGAAAIIFAGTSSTASLPMRFLCSEPLQHVGRVSYCWYLWHWPALIFSGSVFGALSPWGGLAVVAAAWVPAYLTHRYVEQPVLHSRVLAQRPRRALGVLAAGSGTAAVCAIGLALAQPSIPLAPASEVQGAMALERDRRVQERAESLRPDPKEAFEDRTRLVDDGCFIKLGATEQGECAYGQPDSGTTVVLFGDSHAEHYFPALEFLAKRNGWRLVALTKSFCSPASVELRHPQRDQPFAECEEWRRATLERIGEREKPRLVMVAGSTSVRPVREGRELQGEEARRALADGFRETIARIRDSGVQVAVITDPPKAPLDVAECVSENREELRDCAFARPAEQPLEAKVVTGDDGVHLVDTWRAICADGTCRGVIGDAVVYRDRGHLTATFAATLAPVIGRQLPRVN